MKVNKLMALAMLGFAGAYPIYSFATPVVIQDGYVKAGVSDYGTLGSDDTTSPGILYDPTGTASYGVNDFLTPGTPWEGFYITGQTVTGAPYSEYSNNTSSGGYHGGTSFATASPTSITGSSASWTAVSLDGTLQVTNTYTLTTVSGLSRINIVTTMTNLSSDPLSGLEFLRTTDPDPDVNAFGVYDTNNVVLSDSQACATGANTGQTICIYTDSAYTHKAGVSGTTGADAPWTRDPATYLAGTNDGNGDYAIGIGFALGDLAAGDSLSLSYAYQFGATIDVIHPSPEPASLALLGIGLVGLAGLRRRNKA